MWIRKTFPMHIQKDNEQYFHVKLEKRNETIWIYLDRLNASNYIIFNNVSRRGNVPADETNISNQTNKYYQTPSNHMNQSLFSKSWWTKNCNGSMHGSNRTQGNLTPIYFPQKEEAIMKSWKYNETNKLERERQFRKVWYKKLLMLHRTAWSHTTENSHA